MTRALVVLARTPLPGVGKTRLRAHLNGRFVDRLCVALARDTLGWARADGWRLLVAHRGPATPLRAVAGPAATLITQPRNDLGTRIAAAVDAGFAAGAARVVLIGTDSPTMPAALLHAAFDGLDGADATLVPALDGGWIALGVRQPLRDCLNRVRWSAATTFIETETALRVSGRFTLALPPWYDVDEPADLCRLAAEVSGPAGRRAPCSARLLGEMPAPVSSAGRPAA
jgi:uncharacterized protein